MLYDNIMIPYDGSASSKAALAEAVRFAKDDLGLTLRIVQIIDTDQLAIDKLEAELKACGAKQIGETLRINVLEHEIPEDPAEIWLGSWHPLLRDL